MNKKDYSLLAIDDPCFHTQPGQIVLMETKKYESEETISLAFNQNAPVSIVTGINGEYKTTCLQRMANPRVYGNCHRVFYESPEVGYVLYSSGPDAGGWSHRTILGKGRISYEEIAEAINLHEKLEKHPDESPVGLYLENDLLDTDIVRSSEDYSCSITAEQGKEIMEIYNQIMRRDDLDIHPESFKNETPYIYKGRFCERAVYGIPLSTGQMKSLNLLILIVCSPYGILLLDDLENNLHLQVQQDFLEILADLAKKYKKQIIYSTHSPSMIIGHLHYLAEELRD